MRKYIRANTPGATYFFTLTLENRASRLLVDHVDLLRTAMAEVKHRHPFEINAIVVLPDHLHAIWTLPRENADFATRWMLIKAEFSRRVVKTGVPLVQRGSKGERSLWQRRYWEHVIRDDKDFERHVDYVHFNPVKHGLVERAVDWPHSSFHRYVRDDRLSADWGISATHDGRFGE